MHHKDTKDTKEVEKIDEMRFARSAKSCPFLIFFVSFVSLWCILLNLPVSGQKTLGEGPISAAPSLVRPSLKSTVIFPADC